jgi:twinkle protein
VPEAADRSLIPSSSQDLGKRRIDRATCELFRYGVGSYRGQSVQVANYCDDAGRPVAQKLRFPNKDFVILGDSSQMSLFGRHLWRDGGKMLVITEGEIDCLSVSQLQGNKWPVVSIPNGAQAAAKALKKNLEWLERFEKVVLMFDMDDAGRKAAAECALLLTPGKARIAQLPLKDANDMLVAGRGKEVIDAIWNAKTFRPDGIIPGTDLWEQVSVEDTTPSVAYPWLGLQEMTRGLRKRELVTLCSGTGIGKSSVCRELAHHLVRSGYSIGYIALEESVKRTALGLMGIHMNRPLHITRDGISQEDLKDAFDHTVGSGRVCLYDHFGSVDSDNLLNRIRYMVRGMSCDFIFLDHVSIVVSGMGEGDERRLIDNTMTALRSLVEELGCGMVLVSHLKRPEGRGHEEGAQTSLAQLRGSAAIGQLSDMVIGLERDQQDAAKKDLTVVRVLKNRFTGDTGVAACLHYDRSTGRLVETSTEAASAFSEEF